MNNRFRSLILILLLAAGVAAVPAQERTIKQDKLPKAVLEAFKIAYPNAAIKTCSMEKEKGVVTYELETMDGPTRRDLCYAADGTVLSIEEVIPADTLPAAVRDALAKEFPKAKDLTCERVTEKGTTSYEITFKNGKKTLTKIYRPDGTLVK